MQSRFNSQEQFKVLHERYPLVNNSTKGLLLSTYFKMLLADPSNSGLQSDVIAVFTKCSHQMDPDLQQRSAEYLVSQASKHHTDTTPHHTPACAPGRVCIPSPAACACACLYAARGFLCCCLLMTAVFPVLQVLAQNPRQSGQHYVLPMPKWPVRESALLKRLAVSLHKSLDHSHLENQCGLHGLRLLGAVWYTRCGTTVAENLLFCTEVLLMTTMLLAAGY